MQKELDFKGLRLKLLQADIDKEDFPRERFRAVLRIINISETKKRIAIKEDGTKYISRNSGLEYAYQIIPYQLEDHLLLMLLLKMNRIKFVCLPKQ